ncbi:MAG: DUF1499 domain-containing protein [Paracoccaceae bacterium]
MNTVPMLFALIITVTLAYIRLAPASPARWHVDPLTAVRPKTPNAFVLRSGEGDRAPPEFDMPAAELAARFDQLVRARSNAKPVARDPASLFVTYVVRTPLMGFPDYVSVRFVDLGNSRSTLALFSRARFGHSDLGVNKKRALGWLGQL